MSVSAGMAVSSAASAAAAAAAARKAECFGVLQRFDVSNASVEAQREYASCVHAVHGTGEPMSSSMALALKIVIVIVLIGGVVGVIREDYDDGLTGKIMSFIFGAVLTLGFILLAGLVAGSLVFLFS